MSQNEVDPAADTDKFRAFVDSEDSAGARSKRSNATVGVVATLAALVVVAVALWLVLGT